VGYAGWVWELNWEHPICFIANHLVHSLTTHAHQSSVPSLARGCCHHLPACIKHPSRVRFQSWGCSDNRFGMRSEAIRIRDGINFCTEDMSKKCVFPDPRASVGSGSAWSAQGVVFHQATIILTIVADAAGTELFVNGRPAPLAVSCVASDGGAAQVRPDGCVCQRLVTLHACPTSCAHRVPPSSCVPASCCANRFRTRLVATLSVHASCVCVRVNAGKVEISTRCPYRTSAFSGRDKVR
jgi:hypothetical protein